MLSFSKILNSKFSFISNIKLDSAVLLFLLSLLLINIFPEKAEPLEINKLAPNFTLKDQNSKEHNLNSYKGKWILLAFYYSDETFA